MDDKAGGPDTNITMRMKPADMVFKPSTMLTDWQLIQDMFRTSISADSAIDWTEGPQIYSRWSLRIANSFQMKEAGIVLQVLILPEKMETHSPPDQQVFTSGMCMTMTVFEQEVNFFKPNLAQFLPTSPAVFIADADLQPLPNDEEIRANLYLFLLSSRDGVEASTSGQMQDWLKKPEAYVATDTPAIPLVLRTPAPPSQPFTGRRGVIFLAK